MQVFLHQYFYLWIVALVVPLWALIFFQKKESRVEIIYMGILVGTIAMGLDRYCSFYDYWKPPTLFKTLNFESFLYGFFWGGISTKIFEWIFKKEYPASKEPNVGFILIFILSSFFLYMGLLGLFNFNSVHIYILLLVLSAIILIIMKRTLFIVSVISGLLLVVVNMCWYALILSIYPDAIDTIWLTKNLCGLSIFNVPIEEHVYIFAVGCVGSIMYKVATGMDKPTDKTTEYNSGKIRYLLRRIKPYRVPLFFLLIVIGRMVILGEARIPVRTIIQKYI
jgi:hypothetical protein